MKKLDPRKPGQRQASPIEQNKAQRDKKAGSKKKILSLFRKRVLLKNQIQILVKGAKNLPSFETSYQML